MPLWARRMGECSCDAKVGIEKLALIHWNKFPCPPPWNSQLLFKVNWTGKLGTTLGNDMMLRMAHRCNIPIPVNYQQLVTETNGCGLKCQLLIVIIACVFLLVMAVILMAICYKRRSKNKLDSPSHQIALGPYRYYDKGYSGTINGSTPMVRQSETIVIGNKSQTRVLDAGFNSLYTTYVEENLHPENIKMSERQMCLPLNGTFKPVVEHDVMTPSTSSSVDRSPIYETIDGEADSIAEHYHYPYQRDKTLNYQGCHRCGGASTPYDSISSRTSRKRLDVPLPPSRSRTPLDSDCSVSSQRRRKKQPRCESAGTRGDSSSYSDHTELSSLSNSDGSSGRYSAPLTNGSFYSSHVVYR